MRLCGNRRRLEFLDAAQQRWRQPVVPARGQRKGGRLVGTALAAEARDEIANGAVRQAELPRDLGQGTVLQEVGTQDLIVALLRLAGFAKELLASQVVHDRPSEVSLLFRAKA